MFKACFVAKVDPASKSSRVYCQFRNEELGTTTALPNAQHLGNFCFPLGPENVKPKEYALPEEYSFTLTGGDGSHLHGFCRSFLPPRVRTSDVRRNSNLRYPQVLCLISPFPWFPFYFKILQVVEALLKQGTLLTADAEEEGLPANSPAAEFMSGVLRLCKGRPQLGRIVRIPLPTTPSGVNISPQRRIQGLDAHLDRPLQSSGSSIELQIPPDTGNGSWNAGIPLARLFWHLPSGSLMALLQAILLERRILMVAQERDTLSASVHAAAALLYPFRWQHIYLPLLPHNLKDYLSAPMPFLIGVPAPQMLAGLRHLPLEDVVYIDLDSGSCAAGGPGGPPLDFALLPWGHQLQAAFQIVYQMLRSPTEFESTPVIGHCMQEYFLKLLGSYREYVEIDQPEAPPADDANRPPGTRQHLQDDGYLRAHGYRFDHLSFVANQRRSEKARHFLDMLRHSQMYEVFINERLALAAGGYKTSDAFEAKVTFLQSKRGKVLGRFVAQAGAKGVSNLSAVLHRTSTLVKSGVAQIRQAHSPADDGRPHSVDETIVPSYSIDVDAPSLTPRTEGSASLRRPVPSNGEDPTSFFNHDLDADEDAPPVASPVRYASPTRNPPSRPASPLVVASPASTSGRAQPLLSSPRATGIINGGEGFDALLNLDGVEGVFTNGVSEARSRPFDPRASTASSLLDDDGGFAQAEQTSALDPSTWGLGLPSVSEAASSVAEWASSIQALALSFNSSEATDLKSSEPSPSTAPAAPLGTRASYDLKNTNSLGTIDPFREFHSPEALRASSSIRPAAHDESWPAFSPLAAQVALPSRTGVRSSEDAVAASALRSSAGLRSSGSSSLEDRLLPDPFSVLDPIVKPQSTAPMVRSWGSHSEAAKTLESIAGSNCPARAPSARANFETEIGNPAVGPEVCKNRLPAARGKGSLLDM